ncbi:MAG: heme exporter protein [Desulfonauticus sp.]|jgi:heme exporter protein C|nr:MAG: Cytochrome c assembly protein [Desulfonauticus sp. 38_4375]MDK2920789.1 heme exporter protein [Desulfonauticus sp.]
MWLLVVIFLFSLIINQWMIWFYAPVEATLGIVQKIFYLHLPFAWWGMFSFFLVFCFSLLFLFKAKEKYSLLSVASAEIGVLFSGLALVSGSIWAKASWGVWWTWDPRLTTTLVMWFLYSAYLLLQTLDLPLVRKRKLSAVLGVVAFLDVPLVFFSARIFRSIHPAVFASREGGLPEEMFFTLLFSLFTFFFLWIFLFSFRYKQLKLKNKLDGLFLELIKE